MRKKINMEKSKFKVKGLGEWEVIKTNPETKYVQVQGEEDSKQMVSLWIPEAMVETMAMVDEMRKKKESMRKTADYFKAERETYKKITEKVSKENEVLKEKNELMQESISILGHMADDVNEEIQMKFHKHRMATTILTAIAIAECVLFFTFYLLMQK